MSRTSSWHRWEIWLKETGTYIDGAVHQLEADEVEIPRPAHLQEFIRDRAALKIPRSLSKGRSVNPVPITSRVLNACLTSISCAARK
jgi:hypothetical protein